MSKISEHLDEALLQFKTKPSRKTEDNLRRVAEEYYRDGMIGDGSYNAILAVCEEWGV
jgi:hypothetical protein